MSNETNFILPPKSNDKIDKKTLVLDLDETLIHSQHFPFYSSESDIFLKLDLDNAPHDFHVLIRPGAKEFIRKMNKFYELVIFTASVSKYAIPLINLIDEKNLCIHRLYREHCSLVNTSFIKDLTKLGRDLKDIIIVDNSPLAFSLNKENGIPIVSWFEDKKDRELFNLIPILEFLSSVPDVREFIPKLVINNEISYFASIDIMRRYKNEYKNKKVEKPKLSVIDNEKSKEKILQEKNDTDIKKDENMVKKIDKKDYLIKEEKSDKINKEIIKEDKEKIIEEDKIKKEIQKVDINDDDIEENLNFDYNLSDLVDNNNNKIENDLSFNKNKLQNEKDDINLNIKNKGDIENINNNVENNNISKKKIDENKDIINDMKENNKNNNNQMEKLLNNNIINKSIEEKINENNNNIYKNKKDDNIDINDNGINKNEANKVIINNNAIKNEMKDNKEINNNELNNNEDNNNSNQNKANKIKNDCEKNNNEINKKINK